MFFCALPNSHQLNSVIIQDSPPEDEEEMKMELEEQKAQEFEVQKVTIPIDGSSVRKQSWGI